MTIKQWFRNLLGVDTPEQSPDSSAKVLREAAEVKSSTASRIRGVLTRSETNELEEMAKRKERDAQMLRQLAKELDISKGEDDSGV